MKSCDRYLNWISAELDGELSPEELRELKEHLAQCPDCRALAQALREAHAAAAALGETEPPADFAQSVMERIRQSSAPGKVVSLFRRPLIKTLAGLAACAALCLGLAQTGLFQHSKLSGSTCAASPVLPDMQTSAAEETAPRDTKSSLNEASFYDLDDTQASAAGENAPRNAESSFNEASSYDPDGNSAVRSPQSFCAAPAPTPEIAPNVKEACADLAFSSPQYLRVTWNEQLSDPSTQLIFSRDELEDLLNQMPQDDFSELLDTYSANWFDQGGCLLTVLLPETNGNVQLQLKQLLDSGSTLQAVILRNTPEISTSDMVTWLITAEVDDPVAAGTSCTVVLESAEQ